MKARRRQFIHVRDVLKRGNVSLEQNPVGFETRGLPIIDTGCVEADGVQVPVIHEPLGGFRMQAWEAQSSSASVTATMPTA